MKRLLIFAATAAIVCLSIPVAADAARHHSVLIRRQHTVAQKAPAQKAPAQKTATQKAPEPIATPAPDPPCQKPAQKPAQKAAQKTPCQKGCQRLSVTPSDTRHARRGGLFAHVFGNR